MSTATVEALPEGRWVSDDPNTDLARLLAELDGCDDIGQALAVVKHMAAELAQVRSDLAVVSAFMAALVPVLENAGPMLAQLQQGGLSGLMGAFLGRS